MSNSIWKMPDIKPEDGSEILFMIGENHCVGYYDKHSGLYVEPKRFYDTEYAPDEIDRWIYADDLIAQADKAERLQKAVDNYEKVIVGAMFAPDVGAVTAGMLEESHKTIKQLIKGE